MTAAALGYVTVQKIYTYLCICRHTFLPLHNIHASSVPSLAYIRFCSTFHVCAALFRFVSPAALLHIVPFQFGRWLPRTPSFCSLLPRQNATDENEEKGSFEYMANIRPTTTSRQFIFIRMTAENDCSAFQNRRFDCAIFHHDPSSSCFFLLLLLQL